MSAAEVDGHVARRYRLKRRLGKGAYGVVWKAVDRRTGEVVAIKKILDAFRDRTDAQRTYREVTLLQEFRGHPNIVRLLDVIRAENDRDIYLVFESMDTDLDAVIRKGLPLQDVHKRFIFCQLLRATAALHAAGVIHRDQKPSNVLLDADCCVKLCDFGLARALGGPPEAPAGQALTEYVATRWYRAPEVLLASRRYSPGVDMWALGCVLGELLRGRPLFPGTSTPHQLELILRAVPPGPEDEDDLPALGSGAGASLLRLVGLRPRQPLDALLPPDTPPDALDLLCRLLVFAPHRRLSAAQALLHPYVRRFHSPARQWALEGVARLPAPEAAQLSASEYRGRLYQMTLEGRAGGRLPRRKGRGGVETPAPQLQAEPPDAGAGPPPPSATPARNPGLGPPAHEASGPAKRVPGRSSGPQRRPPAPAAPGDRGRPPRASAPASVPPPREPRLDPRPGRRMFRASAAQGAQGAARAALGGGYSQAYGTVCHSALGPLELLAGPRA